MNLQSPCRLSFKIKHATISNNKFVRTIVKLKRNTRSYDAVSQRITVRVFCSCNLANTRTARPIFSYIRSFILFFSNSKGLVPNSRSIIFVLDSDRDRKLFRSLRTVHNLCFCNGIIRYSRINNILILLTVINYSTALDLDRSVLVTQLADFKQVVECSIVTLISYQLIGVCIYISFVRNVCNDNRATSYSMIQFIHGKSSIGNRRFIVNRNYIHCSRVFRRCVTTSRAITDNFILEGSVIITKFIGCSLVRKFAKICNSNSYTRASRSKFCTIQNQGTLIRKAGYNNRSKILCSMLELEFSFSERMLFIFINIKFKGSLNRWEFIVTYNENFVS